MRLLKLRVEAWEEYSAAKGIPQYFLQWDAQFAVAVPSLFSEVLFFLSKDKSKSI